MWMETINGEIRVENSSGLLQQRVQFEVVGGIIADESALFLDFACRVLAFFTLLFCLRYLHF